MGYEAKKTEHCGAKHGCGAYYGPKWEAKKESNRIRRENWKREIRTALTACTHSSALVNPCADDPHFGRSERV